MRVLTTAVLMTETTGSEAGSVSGDSFLLAGGILLVALVTIGVALLFAYRYHDRAFTALAAIAETSERPVTVSSEDSGAYAAAGAARGVGVQSDAGLRVVHVEPVVAGQEVTFTAAGYAAGTTLSWTAAEGDPSAGSDGDFTTVFADAGNVTVELHTVDTQNQPLSVTTPVTVHPAPDDTDDTDDTDESGDDDGPAVVVPFAIRNWGRLVVILFGVGVVGALMAVRVISTEGGVALLGALLGVGASGGAAAEEPSAPAGRKSGKSRKSGQGGSGGKGGRRGGKGRKAGRP